jgi:alpha-galactosidase
MRIVIGCFCVMLAAAIPSRAQQVLAATPPMGWNSWNHFDRHVTDADVRSSADMLVSTGMRDAGYVYVNIDDTWQGKRDEQGIIHSNDRFPDMKALGDYIHSKGLKLGIYSSPGAKTCAGFEGSLGHEVQDAKTYASWGVDFLKYDLCSYADELNKGRDAHPEDPGFAKALMISAYRKMGDALKSTGRPILYSLCQYGVDDVWEWGPQVGAQMWRTTDDINDSYGRMIAIASGQASLSKYAASGHWNDPDMLEVGNGGMTADEYKAHMSLWALLAAPLLAGNDLSKMTDTDKLILMNRDVIAIDQDPLGKQGTRLYEKGDFSVWTKPLSGGRLAIGLFTHTMGRREREVSVNLSEVGFRDGADLQDVWEGKSLGCQSGVLTVRLKKHEAALIIASHHAGTHCTK